MDHSNGLGVERLGRHESSAVRTAFAAPMPDIIAIGPPRTATTWMHRVLRGRVNLPESVKETRFFDLRYANGLAWYAAHFHGAIAGQPTAEIAPTYFYSPEARLRIAEKLPDVRIIATFREPVERLFSLYKLRRASGKITDSFERAIETDEEMRESARYRHHLAEWISIFGRSRTLVLIYEDLVDDPHGFINQLCDFIGIPRMTVDGVMLEKENSTAGVLAPEHAWWTRLGVAASEWMRSNRFDRTMAVIRATGARRLFLGRNGVALPPMDPEFARALRRRLEPEVAAVEKILGRELTAWRLFNT